MEEHPGGTSELLLELNGHRVSRIVIIPMLMRIGAAVVRMDGIGGVETQEEFRNRGYSRRLMETAIARMTAGDAALSTLFGIQDFYQKFGYETTGPEYTVSLPESAPGSATNALPAGWRVRALTDDDLPALMRLYHANTRRSTGALVRHDGEDDPAETARLAGCNPDARKIGLRAWDKLRTIASEPNDDACQVLLDNGGEVVAYAWLGRGWSMEYRRRDVPGAFHLAEGMARDPVAADALLAACRHWANEVDANLRSVAFAIPPEGPLAAASSYEGGQVTACYTRGGDFMGRVLDLDRLIDQMLPELSARIAASRLSFRGRLTLETELGQTSLLIGSDEAFRDASSTANKLTVILPQATLARLCLGGFDPHDMLTRLPTPPDPPAMNLLLALLPQRHPHIFPMDRF